MSHRSQLKQEAAQLRGDIDRHSIMIHQRIGSLKRRANALAQKPAALPIAFAAGILADRLGAPGFQDIRGLLSTLARRVKAESIISGLIR